MVEWMNKSQNDKQQRIKKQHSPLQQHRCPKKENNNKNPNMFWMISCEYVSNTYKTKCNVKSSDSG